MRYLRTLTLVIATAGCAAPQARSLRPVAQVEVRHCAEGAVPIESLGLAAELIELTAERATIRVTNTRSQPLRLRYLAAHFGVARCGRPSGLCRPTHFLRDTDLRPGERVEVHADVRLGELPYACTTLVLALAGRTASDGGSCSDIAAWTAVGR
jgi:hypothetical protein